MIEYRHVTKVFGSGSTAVTAVNDLSFVIERGDFWSLMGPSGSGKSTVLHLIAGLTPPTSGEVLVEGRDVAKMNSKEAAELRRRRVGYVLQTFNLLPFLTAEENVGMPLVLDNLLQRGGPQGRGSARKMAHRANHPTTPGKSSNVAMRSSSSIPRSSLSLTSHRNLTAQRTRRRSHGRPEQRLHVTILLVTHDAVISRHGETRLASTMAH